MAAVALIKFTQGAHTDAAGVAVLGAYGDFSSVAVTNGDNTDVVQWRIYLLDAPPTSANYPLGNQPQLLGSAVNGTPTVTFFPDVAGSYRIMLEVEDALGAVDRDIRNFGIPDERGFVRPPYQKNVDPLPLALPVILTDLPRPVKPDEQNYSNQPRGWAGSGGVGQLEQFFTQYDDFPYQTVTTTPFVAAPDQKPLYVVDLDVIATSALFTLPNLPRTGYAVYLVAAGDPETGFDLTVMASGGGTVVGLPALTMMASTGIILIHLGSNNWERIGGRADTSTTSGNDGLFSLVNPLLRFVEGADSNFNAGDGENFNYQSMLYVPQWERWLKFGYELAGPNDDLHVVRSFSSTDENVFAGGNWDNNRTIITDADGPILAVAIPVNLPPVTHRVIVGYGRDVSGTGHISTSDDGGDSWTARTVNSISQEGPRAMVWSGQNAVIGFPNGGIETSPDGTTWTNRAAPNENARRLAVTDLNGVVLMFEPGVSSTYARSDDHGVSWTTENFPEDINVVGCAYLHGTFYVMQESPIRIAKSTDLGLTFTSLMPLTFAGPSTASDIRVPPQLDSGGWSIMVAFGDFLLTAFFDNNSFFWEDLYYSQDGELWTPCGSQTRLGFGDFLTKGIFVGVRQFAVMSETNNSAEWLSLRYVTGMGGGAGGTVTEGTPSDMNPFPVGGAPSPGVSTQYLRGDSRRDIGVRAPDTPTASSITLTTLGGDFTHLTGGTSMNTLPLDEGLQRWTLTEDPVTFVQSASLDLFTGADIDAEAGDTQVWRGAPGGVTEMVGYFRKSGYALTLQTAFTVENDSSVAGTTVGEALELLEDLIGIAGDAVSFEWVYQGTGAGDPGANNFTISGAGNGTLNLSDTASDIGAGTNAFLVAFLNRPDIKIRLEQADDPTVWDECTSGAAVDNTTYTSFVYNAAHIGAGIGGLTIGKTYKISFLIRGPIASVATPQAVGTAGSAGSYDGTYSNANHVHAHGSQTLGTLHALASTAGAGFVPTTSGRTAGDHLVLDGSLNPQWAAQSSAAVPPLSRWIYVDPNTAVAPGSQDGSIAAPFDSIADAHTKINTAATGLSWVVVLQPLSHAENVTFPVNRKVTYVSWIPDEIDALGYTTDSFPEASIGGTTHGMATTGSANGSLVFVGVNLLGTLTVTGAGNAQIAATDSDINAVVRSNSGTLEVFLQRSVLRSFTGGASGANQGAINGIDSVLIITTAWTVSSVNLRSGVVSFAGAVNLNIAGTLVELRNTSFPGANPPAFNFTGSAGIVRADDISRVNIDQSSGSPGTLTAVTNGAVHTRRLYRYVFLGEHFNSTLGSDWLLNAAAEIGSDTITPVWTVARFDGGSTLEGIGLNFQVPLGCTHITFEVWYRRQSGTSSSINAQLAFAGRYAAHDAAVTGWSSGAGASTFIDLGDQALENIAIPAGTQWARARFRTTLANVGLAAGSVSQIQMIRDPTDGGDNLTGVDLVVRAVIVEVD